MVVNVVQTGPVDFEVRVGSTVIREAATVRTALRVQARIEEADEALMEQHRALRCHYMCDIEHEAGTPCFSMVAGN